MERFKESMLVTAAARALVPQPLDISLTQAHVTIQVVARLDQSIGLELGPASQVVQGDITVDADRKRILDSALAHGSGLDGLVNNAGNMYRAALADLDESALVEVFHQNVIGAMMMSSICAPALSTRGGSIVFLGSIHTRRAFPRGQPLCSHKGSYPGLTKVPPRSSVIKGEGQLCAPGAVPTEINEGPGLVQRRSLTRACAH